MGQATFFKTFTESDKTSTRTLLHESIPITGTIASGSIAAPGPAAGYNLDGAGTQGVGGRGKNVKTFAHGMFQSVYDYPYLSSSSNHIFDVAIGVHNAAVTASSYLTASATNWSQKSKKMKSEASPESKNK